MTGRSAPAQRRAGSRCRSSSASRPRRRPASWRRGSSCTPARATSWPTCSGAAAGSPAPPSIASAGRLARVDPADPDARRGRAAAAGRPPPRRGVPGHGRVAARRVEPQGLGGRPVRDALRDLRPDARRRRVRLGVTTAGRRRPAGAANRSPGTTAARSAATSAAGPSSATAPLDADDLARADADPGSRGARAPARPVPGRRRRAGPRRRAARPPHAAPARRAGGDPRTDRERPAGRAGARRAPPGPAPRAPPVEPARDGQPGAIAALRIAGGHVRLPSAAQWRERNPWLAFEDAFRLVRGFVQQLEGGALGPLQARLGEDLRSLGEGTATAVLGSRARRACAPCATSRRLRPRRARRRGSGSCWASRRCARPRAPRRAYHGDAWVLGREAASLLPIDALAGSSFRPPWSWQAASIGRALEATNRRWRATVASSSSSTAVPEAVVAAVIGGATAGYRVLSARLADPEDELGGSSSSLPPGGLLPPGAADPRQRRLAPIPGGAGDPDMVPGPGLFPPRSDSTSDRSRPRTRPGP